MVHAHAYLRAQLAGRLAAVRMVLATAVTYVFLTRPY